MTEFCLPFGRRQSLEALALVACRVGLDRRWTPPVELIRYLNAEQIAELAQVLLSTVRLTKAIVLPEPISAQDPSFKFYQGEDAFIAKGSERGEGRNRLHGFVPERSPRTQRRAGFLQRVLEVACDISKLSSPLG